MDVVIDAGVAVTVARELRKRPLPAVIKTAPAPGWVSVELQRAEPGKLVGPAASHCGDLVTTEM